MSESSAQGGSDWQSSNFGSICRHIVNGGTPDTSIPAYWNGLTPWITGADFTQNGIGEFRRFVSDAGIQYSATSVVKKGNLLVVTRTGVGKLAIAPCNIAISQDITGVYVDDEIVDTNFAYYLLSRELDELKKLNQGTSINGIVRADLENHIIRFPTSKSIQRKIADIFSNIDTAIEKTEALIAKYQQIKAGLMHDLFSRGVLDNGQLRPPREQAPELYQETAIGWIPKEWDIVAANSICALITKGTTPASHEMWQDGDEIKFLRVDNLTFDGQFNFDSSSFCIALSTHTGALARSRCFPGDVLTNIVGPPLGKVGLITADIGEVNINQAIAVFRPLSALSSSFLLAWLTSTTVKNWFLQRAKQTSGQLNLTLAMCQELPIPKVSLNEQCLINERFKSCENKIRSELNTLEQLKNQKLGLMQDLLTGKVAVKVDTPEAQHV